MRFKYVLGPENKKREGHCGHEVRSAHEADH